MEKIDASMQEKENYNHNQRVLGLKLSIKKLELAIGYAEPDAEKMLENAGKKLEIELIETFRRAQPLESTNIHLEKLKELENKLMSLRKDYEIAIDEYESEIRQAIQKLYQEIGVC